MFLDGQIVSTSYSDLFVVYIDPANKQRNCSLLSSQCPFFMSSQCLTLGSRF
ncbi:hypothetical protein H9I48_01350 [Wolbachia pipientis]|uniref:hypothetical protein n=1 Tax=Wolbachia pipientis TaxID=955 RepID=UPI0016515A80|nr:hypothetical protein [Wolbachia pipientis]MBC6685904.1 hypothetical protein [Wolbachia pipientis]